MPDDRPQAPRARGSQQLVGYGVLVLLLMAVVSSVADGVWRPVGTLVLAVVCLTLFALALRASLREPK